MDASIDNEQLYAACRDDGSLVQVNAFEIVWAYLYRIAYGMLHQHADGDAFAADCAQIALIKIHRNLAQCREPKTFRSWAAQVVRRVVIDELRRPDQARRVGLENDEDAVPQTEDAHAGVETADLRALLLEAITTGPLSERSRRVVIGRYFAEQPDEALAQAERQYTDQAVLPSHIQVTRAKNLAKLRANVTLVEQLRAFVGE